VSASTDGRVCVWDIDQLQQPIDMMDLRIALSIVSNYSTANMSDKKMEASVTSFALQRKESQELYIGTEAGKTYSTKLEQQKNKASGGAAGTSDGADAAADSKNSIALGVDASVAREVIVTPASASEEAHFGPITAMHFNPVLPPHHDGLLLTASLDSSVKLWSVEFPQTPLFSFEPSSEYICDVRWSPVNPALFAVADGSGNISLWNLLKDTEVPVVSTKVAQKALNKIRWSADGKSVIIGDATGTAFVFEVPSEVSLRGVGRRVKHRETHAIVCCVVSCRAV
jgi:dynein intermediate chain